MTDFSRRAGARLFALLASLLPVGAAPAYAVNPPKRIYIVQSYEAGHVCGEPQAEGELQSLASGGWVVGRNLAVKTYYMDTYIVNTSPEAMRAQGQKALQEISEFKPDLIFANDDAAISQVMMALIDGSVPIIFSGMNGQPEMYNERKHFMENREHPSGHVTGIYEKLYAAQAVKVMEQAVPGLRGAKVVMITDHTPTGNGLTKQFEIELKGMTDVRWEIQRVQDWSEYTALIERLNADPEVKAIYPVALSLPADGGRRFAAAQIYDWTLAHSRKPEMAINYFFARMGLFGGAVENFSAMGRLAGEKAVKIFNGTKAGDLPIEDGPESAIVFNVKRARDLGIAIPPRVLAAANAVYKDDLLPLEGRPLLYDRSIIPSE